MMEFMADEAKKAMNELAFRLPRRLTNYISLRGFGEGARLRKAASWLHELNGDPVTGKTKREYRQELGFGKYEEAGEEGAGLSEDAGMSGGGGGVAEESQKNPRLEIEVTIEDIPHRGMPLTYLDGLSEVEFTVSSQTVKLNVVVIRWEIEATHGATLFGVSPTGRRISLAGITWIAFDESRNPDGSSNVWATDEWTYWDMPSLMEQIGASP
jgi:predicted ester cyclase